MAELGITGKRIRKKPKYLREDEEEENQTGDTDTKSKLKSKKPKKDKEKRKLKSKKVSRRSKADEDEEIPPKPGIKLKIKFGGKSSLGSIGSASKDFDESTRDSSNVGSDDVDIEGEMIPSVITVTGDNDSVTLDAESSDDEIGEDYETFEVEMDQEEIITTTEEVVMAATAEDVDTSDEEREWLEAVESGDIEEYEKRKSERNPSVLTARQRRLLHGGDENLMELPSGLQGKPLTPAQIDNRKEKAIKRRQIALEKSEKAKKQTVDRLLKKSDATIGRSKGASKVLGANRPHMRYSITKGRTTLSLPQNMAFPLTAEKSSAPPAPVRCGVTGCRNVKLYNCSKTNVPLCSLQCYKKNLSKLTNGRRSVTVT